MHHINTGFRFWLLILILLCRFSAIAQVTSESDLKKEGDRYFDKEDFEKALPDYSRLLSLYPNNTEYLYRFGVCQLMAGKEKANAYSYIEKASLEPKSPDEVWFYLGKSYLVINEFAKAKEAFIKFKSINASKAKKFDVDAYVLNAENGEQLIKARKNVVIMKTNEVARNNFHSSYDFSNCPGKIVAASDEFFTQADKTKQVDPIMFMSNDKHTILISSYGANGQSGKDIYILRKLADGSWTKAQNLGIVNSEKDEDFPFLDRDGKTLYFSSRGHNSMGGYDIFKSVFDFKTGQWSSPENMGVPINTVFDDLLFVPIDNKNAVYSTNVEAANNSISIRNIEIPNGLSDMLTISGEYIPLDQQVRRDARITVLTSDGMGVVTSVHTDQVTGKYDLVLEPGKSYMLVVEGGGYMPHAETFEIPAGLTNPILKQVVRINKNQQQEEIMLENYFSSGALASEPTTRSHHSYEANSDTSSMISVTINNEVVYVPSPKSSSENTEVITPAENVSDLAGAGANAADGTPVNDVVGVSEMAEIALSEDSSVVSAESVKDSDETIDTTSFSKDITNEELSKIAFADAKNIQKEADALKLESIKLRKAASDVTVYADSLKTTAEGENDTIVNSQVASMYMQADELKKQADEIDKTVAEKEKESYEALIAANNIFKSSLSSDFKPKPKSAQVSSKKETVTPVKKETIVENETVITAVPSAPASDQTTSSNINSSKDSPANEVAVSENNVPELKPSELTPEISKPVDEKAEVAGSVQSNPAPEIQASEDAGIIYSVSAQPTKSDGAQTLPANVNTTSENTNVPTVSTKPETNINEMVSGQTKANDNSVNATVAVEPTVTMKAEIINEGGLSDDKKTDSNSANSTTDNIIAEKVTSPLEANPNSLPQTNSKPDEKTIVAKIDSPLAENVAAPTEKVANVQPAESSNPETNTVSNSTDSQVAKNTTVQVEEKSKEQPVAISNPEVNTVNAKVENSITQKTATESDTQSESQTVTEIKQEATIVTPVEIEKAKSENALSTSLVNEDKAVKDPLVAATNTEDQKIGQDNAGTANQTENLNPLIVPATEAKTIASNEAKSEQAISASESSASELKPEKSLSSATSEKDAKNSPSVPASTQTGVTQVGEEPRKNTTKTFDPNDFPGYSKIVVKEEARIAYRQSQEKLEESNKMSNESLKMQEQISHLRSSPERDSLIRESNDLTLQSMKIWKEGLELVEQARLLEPNIDYKMGVIDFANKNGSGEAYGISDDNSPVAMNDATPVSVKSPEVAVVQSNAKEDSTDEMIDTTHPEYPVYAKLQKEITEKQVETIDVFAQAINLSRLSSDETDQANKLLDEAQLEKDVVRKAELIKSSNDLKALAKTHDEEAKQKFDIAKSDTKDVKALVAQMKVIKEKITLQPGQNMASINKSNAAIAKSGSSKELSTGGGLVVLEKAENKKMDAQQFAMAERMSSEFNASEEDIAAVNVNSTEQSNFYKNVFSRPDGSAYSDANPIPMNPVLPEGLVFKIQIGAFKNPLPASTFSGLQPLSGETTRPGWIRYCVGMFRTFEPANAVKNEIKKTGYKDAFVVAYYNGKRIDLNDAYTILSNKENLTAYKGESAKEFAILRKMNIQPLPVAKDRDVLAFYAKQPIAETLRDNDEETIKALSEVEDPNEVVNAPLEYTVQLGVFSSPVAPVAIASLKPLPASRVNGKYRFTSVTYSNKQSADSMLTAAVGSGIKDAFVVGIRNGNFVALENSAVTAKQKQWSSSIKEDVTSSEMVYKVQIGAFKNQLPYNIVETYLTIIDKGITHRTDERGLVIFYAGNLKDLASATKLRQEITAKGIKDAFVVVLQNGKRVSIPKE